MGFIERLRQEKEAEVLRIEQQRTQQEAQEKARLQREAAKEELRAQRRQQAERFQRESGIDTLLNSFFKVADATETRQGGYGAIDSTEDSTSIVRIVNLYSERGIAVEMCPDGTIVFWGGKRASTETQPKPMTICEKLRNYFTASSLGLNPTIESVLRTPIRSIPELNWRDNPSVLEDGLEEVYKTPFYLHIVGYDD